MRLLTMGAIGAAIYGVFRGMKNGTFKQLTNKLNGQNLQQIAKPLQQMTQPLQGMTNTALAEKQPKQQG